MIFNFVKRIKHFAWVEHKCPSIARKRWIVHSSLLFKTFCRYRFAEINYLWPAWPCFESFQKVIQSIQISEEYFIHWLMTQRAYNGGSSFVSRTSIRSSFVCSSRRLPTLTLFEWLFAKLDRLTADLADGSWFKLNQGSVEEVGSGCCWVLSGEQKRGQID